VADAVKKLVLATRNEHKLREIAAILAAQRAPAELVGLAEFPGAPDVEETGETLKENALLKAGSAAEFTGLAAAADDTGLFVDALGGEPGVRSARYAGDDCVYEKNNRKLLTALAGLPPEKRAAHFECVVALAVPGKPPLFFKGELQGRIIEAPRGDGGFGYDPIFQPADMDATLSELLPEAKNAISHRFIAFRRLGEFLVETAQNRPGLISGEGQDELPDRKAEGGPA
jgi:XTP/dITP diphosphohydrolase